MSKSLQKTENGSKELSTNRRIAQAANKASSQNVIRDYRSRRAPSTLVRQDCDLELFAEYLENVGIKSVGDLSTDPTAWSNISWGLVDTFVKWLVTQGYAVSTTNVKLSTVRVYAGLAAQAGTLSVNEIAHIRLIKGYSITEGKRVDANRKKKKMPTRIGRKKAAPIMLTDDQAKLIKQHPDTPQGRRDAVIMTLLMEHGLRVGELSVMTIDNINLPKKEMHFYRPKIDEWHTHALTPESAKILRRYIKKDAINTVKTPLLRKSYHNGELGSPGITSRNISQRVKLLGSKIGVFGLSAHDCRHYWATVAAKNKTPLESLISGGGWHSPSMPMRYIDAGRIRNEGVVLNTEGTDE